MRALTVLFVVALGAGEGPILYPSFFFDERVISHMTDLNTRRGVIDFGPDAGTTPLSIVFQGRTDSQQPGPLVHPTQAQLVPLQPQWETPAQGQGEFDFFVAAVPYDIERDLRNSARLPLLGVAGEPPPSSPPPANPACRRPPGPQIYLWHGHVGPKFPIRVEIELTKLIRAEGAYVVTTGYGKDFGERDPHGFGGIPLSACTPRNTAEAIEVHRQQLGVGIVTGDNQRVVRTADRLISLDDVSSVWWWLLLKGNALRALGRDAEKCSAWRLALKRRPIRLGPITDNELNAGDRAACGL